MFVSAHICFSCTMEIHVSHVLGIVWISASSKIFEKLICLNVYFFPYFPRVTGIHFSHVLGILWISASPEICKKLIIFCVCVFHNTFSVLCKSTFPMFWNCMSFCFKRKISETLNFEMFVFSHNFSLLW